MVVITMVRWGYVHQLIKFGGPHCISHILVVSTCFHRPGTKRYLAVAEKCYEGAICTIFDLVTAKTLGTLQPKGGGF